ncbi:MAG: glycoside hydrolase, partial [Thermoplasmata archaeon]|nr:glycoside hydrolase [Thermoplasmata archaeon]
MSPTVVSPGSGGGRWMSVLRPSVRRRAILGALGIVVLFLLPTAAVAAPGHLAAPSAAAHPAVSASLPSPSLPHHARSAAGAPSAFHAASPPSPTGAPAARSPTAPPPLGPPSSGRGTFFANTQFPLPPTANLTCLTGYAGSACVNVTNEPSINFTSDGTLAVAYNALTNESPCGNVTNITMSLIGFRASFNNGTSWTKPRYLGNPDCSVAANFPNAMEPSLTSLANGTLVLTYLEFNNTSQTGYLTYPPYFYFYALWNDRLVVSESYDDGTNWTTPTVLNSSVNPQAKTPAYTQSLTNPPDRPWVTARGDSIYVVWMNSSDPSTWIYPSGSYRSGVHLIASTDGGKSWGAQQDLKSWWGSYFGYASTDYSVNPMVTTSPSGEVFVGYASAFNYAAGTYCEPYPPYLCQNYIPTMSLILASSTNNGSSFNYTTVVDQTPVVYQWGPYVDPSPQLSYSAVNHQLYYAYTSGLIGNYCFSYGCYQQSAPDVFITNSSNDGVSFSTPHPVSDRLLNPYGGAFASAYNPAMVVDASGRLHLELSFVNQSYCYAVGVCGIQFQVYLNSTDNGSTFTAPIIISGNATYYPYTWDGEYDSMATDGVHFWAAYTLDVCPGYATAACYYPSTGGVADVTVGSLFQGGGYTVTFLEKNLTKGTTWSAELLGNERQGVAGSGPTGLTVSGVPGGQTMFWAVPWVNLSYGVAMLPTLSATGPGAFTSSSTIYANFTEWDQLRIATSPALPSYLFLGFYLVTISISPLPGFYWLPHNSSFSAWVNNTGATCPATGFCYLYNLTFLSWTGVGASSVSSANNSVSGRMGSAVNETANLRYNGICQSYPPYYNYCYNATTFGLTFNESGLPSGVAWAVTIDGNVTQTTAADNMTFAVSSAPTPYVAWTVPDPGTGMVWVPTASAASPVLLPQSALVQLNYTLVNVSHSTFSVNFTETGLPGLTSWSLEVGSLEVGVATESTNLVVPGGASAPVNASYVFLNNGTGYFVSRIVESQFVMNESSPTSLG